MTNNVDELINLIKNIEIKSQEEFNGLSYLLNLPKDIYLVLIEAIAKERISVLDFKNVMSDARNNIYKGRQDSKTSINEKLLNKFNNQITPEIKLERDFIPEQYYIVNYLNDNGIKLDKDYADDIFVDERNIVNFTTNFFDIELTYDDTITMNELGLSEKQMKKKKSLDAFLDIKMNYKY